MFKKSLLLCSLSLLLPASLVLGQDIPTWLFSVSGSNLSSAGTNDYAQNLDPSQAENPVALYTASPQFGMNITYWQKPNQSQELTVLHYVTRWSTGSITGSNFAAPYTYDGYQNLNEISLTTNTFFNASDDLTFIIHTSAVYDFLRTVTNLSGTPTTAKALYLQQGVTDFTGIGPRLGMSLQHTLPWNLTLTNRIDLGLSYGQIKSSTLQADNTLAHYTPAHNVLVTNLDLSVALNYEKQIKAHYWEASGGVQYQTFLNVSNDHNSSNNNYQNVSFYGPFVRVAYGF